MKKFQVEIEEILQHVYEIKAESLEEAIGIAGDRYSEGKYVLYPEDIKETNFREYKDEIVKDKSNKNRESR